MKKFLKFFLFLYIITSFIIIDYNFFIDKVDASSLLSSNNLRIEKNTNTSVKLIWDKLSKVSSYEIYMKEGKNYKYLDTVNNNESSTWIHNNLIPNKKYTYAMRYINYNGNKSPYSFDVSLYLGSYNSMYTNVLDMSLFSNASIVELNKQINISLNIIKENSNLELIDSKIKWYVSDDSHATIDNKGTLTAKKEGLVTVFARAHNGKTASLNVRVVNNSKNMKKKTKASKSSNYSKKTAVSKLTIAAPSKLKSRRNTSKSIKITWKKVKGATKYEVYRKNKKKYYKIAVVKGNSYIDKKVKKNKQYYYSVRSVKLVSKKEIKSSFSDYSSYILCSKKGKYTNVKKIRFTIKTKKVMEKSNLQLKYIVLKENKNKKLKNNKLRWWTSNKNVAIVNNKGKVTALNYGKVIIYAKSHNGIVSKYKLSVDSKYARKLPILTFHRIVTDYNKKTKYPNDQWVASVKDFERQMKYLHDNHYLTISANEFESWYNGNIEYPKKTVMLTFDDGDYEFYYLVYPILKKYNFKATSFIIGSYTGEITNKLQDNGRYRLGKDTISRMLYKYSNVKFESHSYNLHYITSDGSQAVVTKSYQEIMDDFKNNSEFNFRYLAYPYGKVTPEFLNATKNSGIRMAFYFGTNTYATRNNDRYQIPRVKVNGQISYSDYLKKLKEVLE